MTKKEIYKVLPIRQGELVLKPIENIPKNSILSEEVLSKVVSHSETGHHHILESKYQNIKVYTLDNNTYLEVPELSKLWHNKTGNHAHKTLDVNKGAYEVILKKEFDYFKKVIKLVRD